MPPKKKNFETAQTRNFRERVLSRVDERTINHVEEFGCSVVSGKRTKYGLAHSFHEKLVDGSR